MILTLFILGFAATFFGIFNFIKRKNILAFFFVFMGLILLLIGYFVVHFYPQTLPESIRSFLL